MPIKIFTALIVQDMQNDFMSEGVLPVAGAETVMVPIAAMAETFSRVIVTQDFRPANHIVFAESHSGRKVGETIQTEAGTITLKPKFCIEGSVGADLAKGLRLPMSRVIALLKGTNASIDSYSAFLEADRKTETGLQAYCEDRFVNRVYLCGLNREDGLVHTALDARHYEHDVYWVVDAVAGFDPDGADAATAQALKLKGVHFVTSQEVLNREIK